MKLASKLRRVAAVGALATALVGLTATSATAADIAGTNEKISTNVGYVAFHHKGDKLIAHDGRVDGACITAELKYKGSHYYAKACNMGRTVTKNYNFKEGAGVYLRLCYLGSSGTECTDWYGAHA